MLQKFTRAAQITSATSEFVAPDTGDIIIEFSSI
jgi:hypothetical protein